MPELEDVSPFDTKAVIHGDQLHVISKNRKHYVATLKQGLVDKPAEEYKLLE
jgi:hypothetical protein